MCRGKCEYSVDLFDLPRAGENDNDAVDDDNNELGSAVIRVVKFEIFMTLFSETSDVQSTYHMYVENSRSGIMKRSGMDVDVISDGQTLPIYSVSRRL